MFLTVLKSSSTAKLTGRRLVSATLAVGVFATSFACTCAPCSASDANDVLPADTQPSDVELKKETPKEDSSSSSGFTGQLTYPGASKQPSLTVDDVKIEGNRLVPSEDILGVVKTKRGDKFDRDVLLQDLKAINGMGYFDDRSLQALPEMSNGGVLLKIRVQENAPITQFSFDGNEALGSEELSQIFANQLGKPQNLNDLSSSIDKVEQLYHDKGFLLARVVDVKDDPDGNISLKVNEGQIESVQIGGNRKTKDFIIRNALKVKPGMVYNEKQLTADLKKLYANGYFQDIRRSLQPSATSPDKYVLKVEVDEKRSGSVGVGGGVDSIAGPFGNLSFSDNNFRGRGQIVSFNSQMGTGMFGQGVNAINNPGNGYMVNKNNYQVEATFVEPNFLKTGTSLAVSGFGRNFSSMMVDQSTQRTLGASATFTRKLRHNTALNLGLIGENTALRDYSSMFGADGALNQMTERALTSGLASTQAGASALANQVRDQQLRGGTFFTVNPSLTYDTRDGVDPKKGTFAKLSAGPSLGMGAPSFAKLGASVSKYIPVTKDITLATNFQGGTAIGGMPQFAQYRLGGWNGIRGYRMFSDLGTGTGMLMATAELRSRLPMPRNSKVGKVLDKHVKLTAFCDAGKVMGNSLTNNLYGRSMLGASVGVGLRVNIPMLGLVRFEYGMPLVSSILGDFTPRINVGFGDRF
ncbi:MAG: BamA/TamA family outer membrane protein [Candidatus Melainabacteria bacterium]|nr:BamA/TamA family outer membrane protein [Candidatus Melainabacteria bacterium]